MVWFPFSLPKDTTPKILFVYENEEDISKTLMDKNACINRENGKNITKTIVVKLIIPPTNKNRDTLTSNIFSKSAQDKDSYKKEQKYSKCLYHK